MLDLNPQGKGGEGKGREGREREGRGREGRGGVERGREGRGLQGCNETVRLNHLVASRLNYPVARCSH